MYLEWIDMDETKKTNLKSKKINIGILIIILVVIAGSIGVIFYKVLNNKNNFRLLIDDVFDYLEANITSNDHLNGEVSFKINGTGSSTEVFQLLNKADFSISYDIDYGNKLANYNIKSNYDNDNLFDINFYISNNDFYFYLNNLYDKYIKYDNIDDVEKIFQNIKKDDYKILISSIRNSLNKALKEEYFTTSKDVLEGRKVVKTTLELTKENCQEIERNFIELLSKDEDFVNSYASLSGKDIQEIRNSLNEAYDNIDSKIYEDVRVILYTNRMQFVGLEVMKGEEELTIFSEGKDSYRYNYNFEYSYSGKITINKTEEAVITKISIENSTNGDVIELTVTNKDNAIIEPLDTSNSINYDEISEEELRTIMDTFSTNKALNQFIEDFGTFDFNNVNLGKDI